jgi:hypothetical protein
MIAMNTPHGHEKNDNFSLIRKLLRRHSILSAEPAEPTVLTCKMNIDYVVVGLSRKDPGLPADLCDRIAASGLSSSHTCKRTAIIAEVDSIFQPIDFLLLSAKFGCEYDRFLLLNDVAMEACGSVRLNLNIIGSTHDNELIRPLISMACTYWT